MISRQDVQSTLFAAFDWMRTRIGILLATALAAALCGLFVHERGYVLVCAVLPALLVGSIWPWLSLRPLSATLSFERPRIGEGQTVKVNLTVRNRWPIPIWGVTNQGVVDEPNTRNLPLLNLPGWRTTRTVLSMTPNRRGEYPNSTPQMICGFPFGLWFPHKAIEVGASLKSPKY